MDYNNYPYENEKKVSVENKYPKNGSNLSIISLVFGIISLVVCWALIFPVILGIIGLIIGIKSLVQRREGDAMAVGGVITSSIGLVCGIIGCLLFVLFS